MLHASTKSTYAAFWIFRLDPTFHRISDDAQRLGKAEFLSALEHLPTEVELRGCYSLVGLRDDADLMFWVIGIFSNGEGISR